MALTADQELDAGSHLNATGLGTRTATFTMGSTIPLKVQSVVATINNTAGSDALGKVTIEDGAGQVIATSEQTNAIPAGDTGTQTFALRLGANGGGGASSLVHANGFYGAVPAAGNPVPAGTQATYLALTFGGAGAGTDLLDVVNGVPFCSWTVKTAGMYMFMARIGMDPHPAAPWPAGSLVQLDLSPLGADPPPADFNATQTTCMFPLDNTFTGAINTVITGRYCTPGEVFTGGRWAVHVNWNYVGDVDINGFVEAIRIY